MGLTTTLLSRECHGSQFAVRASVAFDSSYLTSGEQLDASILGLAYIQDIDFEDSEGYTFDADIATDGSYALLKAYRSPDSAAAFTGTAQTDIDFTIKDDDTAATNGTKVYLAQERGKTQEGMLWSEMAGAATVTVTTATGSLVIPVIHKLTEDATIKVVDDDTAASNGTALKVHLTGETTEWGADIGYLTSANAGNADNTFASGAPTSTFRVYDADTAPGCASQNLQIYFDDNGATVTARFLVINPTGHDVYVRSSTTAGRYWKLTHDASAASNGVALYFDDDASTATDKLLCVTANNATVTTSYAGHQLGVYAVDGYALSGVFFDDDGTTESDRLISTISATVDSWVYLANITRMLKVKYAASTSAGVQLYINDDDTATVRFCAVNAGNANSTVQLDPTYKSHGEVAAGAIVVTAQALEEQGSGVSMSAVTVNLMAYGK